MGGKKSFNRECDSCFTERFLFLRMTSKTVGCCDVRVFLRLREVTDGGSLPLAVKKLVGTDASGVQGRV